MDNEENMKYDERQYPNAVPVVEAEGEVKHEGEFATRRYTVQKWVLPALSPFIFVLIGLSGLIPGWWAWGWVIIPVSGIIGTPMPFWIKSVSLSPFIFVLIGMLGLFPGWWAWGWIIIPVCGILSSGVARRT